jgi:gluconokinase
MILILMGVAGSGKTSIGQKLALELGWPFYDGDDYHPAANLQKMAARLPLDDLDREPWLAALRELIIDLSERGQPAVLAASLLKESYRKRLLNLPGQISLIYLKGDYDLIHTRLVERANHFMQASMLASQFAVLEEPHDALVIDIRLEPQEIIRNIRAAFTQ